MQVLKLCSKWNTPPAPSADVSVDKSDEPWACVGVVAGATDLVALERIRSLAPNMWILCPGVGAQGGEVEVRGCLLALYVTMTVTVVMGAAVASHALVFLPDPGSETDTLNQKKAPTKKI